ncbi:lysozyme inhibitor LprI family protein [Lentisalinibacter orientalis]|uniref:hypothetical protein n=1 Tax=Lentisalinibacter orientalis TaxID=2992241 RepID=UPI00386BBCAD
MRVTLTIAAILLALAACSPGPEGGGTTGGAQTGNVPDRCAGITDPVERAVCADVDLRAMDADLTRLYQRALARADHTAKASLRNEHAAWERGLRDCLELPEAERRDCLDERYNARLADLAPRP